LRSGSLASRIDDRRELRIRLGLLDRCRDALNDSGREMALFDSVEADPSRRTLLAAVEREIGAVSVVGFGGGSPTSRQGPLGKPSNQAGLSPTSPRSRRPMSARAGLCGISVSTVPSSMRWTRA
jgi:hypothetical protein